LTRGPSRSTKEPRKPGYLGNAGNIRITELLAEVDRWTSFTSAFTHLRSGFPAEDRRVKLSYQFVQGAWSLEV
jgi:hypothetical protein